MTKYNAKKVIVTEDGTIFDSLTVKQFNLDIRGIQCDSMMEGEYLQHLLRSKKEGLVTEIECHPSYKLHDGIVYIADFAVTYTDGTFAVIDVKGVETPAFRMKAKMFRSLYPDLELRVITKFCGQWMTTKEVRKAKSENKKAEVKLLKRIAEQERVKHGRQPKQRTPN